MVSNRTQVQASFLPPFPLLFLTPFSSLHFSLPFYFCFSPRVAESFAQNMGALEGVSHPQAPLNQVFNSVSFPLGPPNVLAPHLPVYSSVPTSCGLITFLQPSKHGDDTRQERPRPCPPPRMLFHVD